MLIRKDSYVVIGRAARNKNGKVILYADTISDAMEYAISETKRRREIQNQYNIDNNIIPTTIVKEIPKSITMKNAGIKNNKMRWLWL